MEHATRLLENAEKAARVVGGLIEQLPAGKVPAALRSKLDALLRAISQVKVRAQAPS